MLISSAPVSSSKRIASRAVCLIYDINHERLHFLIAQPRKSWPGYLAVGRLDYHVRMVTRLRIRNDAGVEILEHRIPKALLRQILGEPLHQLGIRRNLMRGFDCQRALRAVVRRNGYAATRS